MKVFYLFIFIFLILSGGAGVYFWSDYFSQTIATLESDISDKQKINIKRSNDIEDLEKEMINADSELSKLESQIDTITRATAKAEQQKKDQIARDKLNAENEKAYKNALNNILNPPKTECESRAVLGTVYTSCK